MCDMAGIDVRYPLLDDAAGGILRRNPGGTQGEGAQAPLLLQARAEGRASRPKPSPRPSTDSACLSASGCAITRRLAELVHGSLDAFQRRGILRPSYIQDLRRQHSHRPRDVLRHHDLGRSPCSNAGSTRANCNLMLFNSVEFIFGFLPVVGAGLLRSSRAGAIRRRPRGWRSPRCSSTAGGTGRMCRCWSLQPRSTTSVAFISRAMCAHAGVAPRARCSRSRSPPICCCSGYYKYANFFLGIWGSVTGNASDIGQIILPLGISFFTFTQIAFLVDVYRGDVEGIQPDPLRTVRHLLSAPDRRPDPAPQGDDAAVPGGANLSAERWRMSRSA